MNFAQTRGTAFVRFYMVNVGQRLEALFTVNVIQLVFLGEGVVKVLEMDDELLLREEYCREEIKVMLLAKLLAFHPVSV